VGSREGPRRSAELLIDGGEGGGSCRSGGGGGPGGEADLEVEPVEEFPGVVMGPALGEEVGMLLVELRSRAVEALGGGLVCFV
jgi:hypothetical protein